MISVGKLLSCDAAMVGFILFIAVLKHLIADVSDFIWRLKAILLKHSMNQHRRSSILECINIWVAHCTFFRCFCSFCILLFAYRCILYNTVTIIYVNLYIALHIHILMNNSSAMARWTNFGTGISNDFFFFALQKLYYAVQNFISIIRNMVFYSFIALNQAYIFRFYFFPKKCSLKTIFIIIIIDRLC